MKAVILAGGLGTRLQPYTTFLPKPMLPLGEKPLLEHVIEWILRSGITDIVLCVSYLKRTIEEYFGNGERFGVNVEYASSSRPLATAGQLKTAQDLIDDTFVCMYGDSLFDFNLQSMIRRHRSGGRLITVGLYRYRTTLPYGVIETENGGSVIDWKEKPQIGADINMGCYIMEPQVLSYIPKNRQYGMDRVIKQAIRDKKSVGSFLIKKGFVDIGDKTSYRMAQQQFLNRLGSD